MNDLKDRIIMITGASSGFGKETAKMCVALGAKVVLGARREDKLKELCLYRFSRREELMNGTK